jgi:hypothetical protein
MNGRKKAQKAQEKEPADGVLLTRLKGNQFADGRRDSDPIFLCPLCLFAAILHRPI